MYQRYFLGDEDASKPAAGGFGGFFGGSSPAPAPPAPVTPIFPAVDKAADAAAERKAAQERKQAQIAEQRRAAEEARAKAAAEVCLVGRFWCLHYVVFALNNFPLFGPPGGSPQASARTAEEGTRRAQGSRGETELADGVCREVVCVV